MSFIHWSNKVITEVTFCFQTEHSYKPRGLWISDEKSYGWKQWCEDNDYHCGKIAHSVSFAPKHKILILNNPRDLTEFANTYSYSYYSLYRINWIDVARKYHGILITPYQFVDYSHKEYEWYYGWDCASGCIWNPLSIQVSPLAPNEIATCKK